MHLCFEMFFLRQQFKEYLYSEMYFLRQQFKEYLYSEMYFLREQFWETLFFERATYVLKCMKNLFKIHGCWLVFTASKNFCNIDMYKYKFKMYKRLWITVNQTNRWAGSVFQGSVWSPATFKKVTASSQWNLDKAGCAKMSGRSVR